MQYPITNLDGLAAVGAVGVKLSDGKGVTPQPSALGAVAAVGQHGSDAGEASPADAPARSAAAGPHDQEMMAGARHDSEVRAKPGRRGSDGSNKTGRKPLTLLAQT